MLSYWYMAGIGLFHFNLLVNPVKKKVRWGEFCLIDEKTKA